VGEKMKGKDAQMMLGARYADWDPVEGDKQRVLEQFTEVQIIEFARAGMMINRISVAGGSLNVVGFRIIIRGYKQIDISIRSKPCLGVVSRNGPTLDEYRFDPRLTM
jgi:hypothetical protein